MHHKYFVGHRRPEFPLWDGFQFFEIPAERQQAEGSAFEDNFPDHRLFNEYSFLFLLRRHLEQAAPGELVTICQYRRFVLNRPIGQPSTNAPWSTTIPLERARALAVRSEIMPAPGQSYLIGSSITIERRVLGQYSLVHFTRDILRFTAGLVDAGIMSDKHAYDFLTSPALIPSPSIGTFPVDAFVTMFRLLEKAAASFWSNGYRPYQHPYQGRVLSFLLERLNSYLLLRYLIDHGVDPNAVMGSTVLISETAEVRPGSMAAA
jgi:hypothetical protein